MKRELLRPFLVAALLAIGLSSLAGCYYDDHDDWRGRGGYYHRYDRDDYGYRRGYDRDDYGRRGRFDHDHDDD
jgi:hypothetical protein